MTLARLCIRFLAPYRVWMIALLALQAVQAGTQLLLPALIGDVVDDGALRGDIGAVLSGGLVMLVVATASLAAAAGAVWCGSRAALGMARDLRQAALSQVLTWSAREVQQLGPASTATRLTNDIMQMQQLVAAGCAILLVSPLTVVGGVVMAVREDPPLAVVLVIAIPLMVVSLAWLLQRTGVVAEAMQMHIDRLNAVVREQVIGLRVVRAFVREPWEVERFARVNTDLSRSMLTSGQLLALMTPLILLILNVSSIAVLHVGAGRVESGDASVGQLVAFLNYLGLVLVAVIMAGFTTAMLPRALTCARRVDEILRTPSSLRAVTATHSVERISCFEARRVGFRYPGAESAVLHDIDLTLRCGTTTAVVGSTGAGKTTLVNLVARLLEPTDGEIAVDGRDIRELDPDQLRRRIGLVPQKAHLFVGTVAENLRLGVPRTPDSLLWEALEAAQIAEAVHGMPGGLDTRVEQGGANFSGGQRQRLCIARALVRRPDLYVFDDAFSALDAVTESQVRDSLVDWTRDAAVLIVSERIGAIMSADEILVLESATVVGRGTHNELLSTCTTYREIDSSQVIPEPAA